jgi:EAL domain-containing protein (putative c-di-GMP-specific phosphodiesterase class I)
MFVHNSNHGTQVSFHQRRRAPLACIIDRKPHICAFLGDAIENLGFTVHPCPRAGEIRGTIANLAPDLVVLGTLASEADLRTVLSGLALERYAGRVMLFGGRASSQLLVAHDYGENVGLSMLPPLLTPFRDSDLHDNLAAFLPIRSPPRIEIEAEEALANDWIEVWYRPNIDLRALAVIGAQAELYVRHPTWGVLAPSSFLPGPSDPQLLRFMDIIVDRTMSDWSRFLGSRQAFELTVPVPVCALEQPEFVERLCLKTPDEGFCAQLTVEIPGIELSRNPAKVRAAAKRLAQLNVGIAVDDLTGEASWIDLHDFPIAHVQVDGQFIADCADDQEKADACGKIVRLAKKIGARTVAKGIATTAALKAVHALGFDLGQGELFGKAMDAPRFVQFVLRR